MKLACAGAALTLALAGCAAATSSPSATAATAPGMTHASDMATPTTSTPSTSTPSGTPSADALRTLAKEPKDMPKKVGAWTQEEHPNPMTWHFHGTAHMTAMTMPGDLTAALAKMTGVTRDDGIACVDSRQEMSECFIGYPGGHVHVMGLGPAKTTRTFTSALASELGA